MPLKLKLTLGKRKADPLAPGGEVQAQAPKIARVLQAPAPPAAAAAAPAPSAAAPAAQAPQDAGGCLWALPEAPDISSLDRWAAQERQAQRQDATLASLAAEPAPQRLPQAAGSAAKPKRGRGRPRKHPLPAPSDAPEGPPKPKRGRGRPKGTGGVRHWKPERAAQVVASLGRKDRHSIFLEVVEEEHVPGYYAVIREAMALDLIRKRLAAGRYTGWQAIKDDVDLMCNNAMYFNEAGSIYHKVAMDMYSHAQKLFKTASGGVLPIRRGASLRAGGTHPPVEADVDGYAVPIVVAAGGSAGGTGGEGGGGMGATPEPSTLGGPMHTPSEKTQQQDGGGRGDGGGEGDGVTGGASALSVPLVFPRPGVYVDLKSMLQADEQRRRTWPKPPSVISAQMPKWGNRSGPSAAAEIAAHQRERDHKAALTRAWEGRRALELEPAARVAVTRPAAYAGSLARFARGLGGAVARVIEEMGARLA